MSDTSVPEEDYAEMLVDGHRVLPSLLADLAAAERTIHMSMFLFFRDPVAEQVADVLAMQARRGVAVRLLLNIEKTRMGDPFSTGEKEMIAQDPHVHYDPLDVQPIVDRLREAGAEVHDTNIDYDALDHLNDARLRSIAAQIKDTIDVDDLHIDHRKVVVIDGHIGYCGGANVGAQYVYHHPFDPKKHAQHEAAEWKKQDHPEPWWKWHDSLTRFEGPIVRALDAQFRDRWMLDGGCELAPVGDRPNRRPGARRGVRLDSARVLTNEPNNRPNAIRELYLRLIRDAERSIFIENPYLYHQAIAEALVFAKRRRPELRIDLVLPAREWNDNKFGHDAQQYYYASYVDAGIAVHEYQCHFNHLKMAVFDERWSIHGSTNLNYRSLEDDKDFELVVLVDSEELARRVLCEVRDVDVPHSKTFTPQDLAGPSLAHLRVRTRDPRTLLLLSRRVL